MAAMSSEPGRDEMLVICVTTKHGTITSAVASGFVDEQLLAVQEVYAAHCSVHESPESKL